MDGVQDGSYDHEGEQEAHHRGVAEPADEADHGSAIAWREAEGDGDFECLAETGESDGDGDSEEEESDEADACVVDLAEKEGDEEWAGPVDGVGGDGGEHLGEEDGCGRDGVREEPLPHGVAALREIELEAFSLADEHSGPEDEEERAEEWGEAVGAAEVGEAVGDAVLGDEFVEIAFAVGGDELLFDVVLVASVVFGDAAGFDGVLGGWQGLAGFGPVGGVVGGVSCVGEEVTADDDFAGRFGVDVLADFDRGGDGEGGHDVDGGHEEDGQAVAEDAPVSALVLGALVEELLLAAATAVGAVARVADEQTDGSPEAGWGGGLEDHACWGRAVSWRKMSSSEALSYWARRSGMEPRAMRRPSFMMTAWEQRRVT